MIIVKGTTSVTANANLTSLDLLVDGLPVMVPINQCSIALNVSNDLYLSAMNGQSYLIDPTIMTSPSGTVAAIQTALEALITVPNGGGGSYVGIPFTQVTVAAFGISVNNGYIANGAALVTLTLPVLAATGTRIEISGKGVGGWLIAQNAGQIIHLGSTPTTVGVGGSLASTNDFDYIILTCIRANMDWNVHGVQGNITVV